MTHFRQMPRDDDYWDGTVNPRDPVRHARRSALAESAFMRGARMMEAMAEAAEREAAARGARPTTSGSPLRG